MLTDRDIPQGVKIEETPFGPRLLWPRDGQVWVYSGKLPTWMPESVCAAFRKACAEFAAKNAEPGKGAPPDAVR